MINGKSNLVLIGMSGSGKSTLGVLLAKALGMDFSDTDILIQRHTGVLLQETIDCEGIGRFLEIEEEVLSELEVSNCIIATGGSAVYSEKAMKHLKKDGTALFLYVSYDEIRQRITNISTRGIVARKGETLRGIYDERLPLYEKYSDIIFDCTGKDIEKSVEEIAGKLCFHSISFS